MSGDSLKPHLSKSKKMTMTKSKGLTVSSKVVTIKFLTSKAKVTFTQLRIVFIKATIFQYFDPDCYIQIITKVLNYAIGIVLSQLNLDQAISTLEILLKSQWHPVTYFSRKIIFAKTWYKTHKDELLTVVKAFKIWRHYLEGYKYKVLVFTNYNNFCQFMDTKSLSSHQIWWAKKLPRYYFPIDYC